MPSAVNFSLILSVFLSLVHPASAADSAAASHGEGQRRADLGNGTYRNPVLAGDHADPSVLKVDADYYMVHSSFDSVPGLLLWHSRDLVNWEPIGCALNRYVGTVWAPDIVRHNRRFYIYFPVLSENSITNMVVHADDIRGPWSEPVDLRIGNYDPGHAVGPDGKRYLFMSGGYRVSLAADGLSSTGPAEKVYDGWRYPEEWDVETSPRKGRRS